MPINITMGDLVIDDPVTAISLFGTIITIIVSLFMIWSYIRRYSREAKLDVQNSNRESETRIKEYFDLRIATLEERLAANTKSIERLERQNEKLQREREARGE